MDPNRGSGGGTEDTLPSDRCPNCGGPLRFEGERPEGHCTACDIYVEILRPLPVAPDRPPLVRAEVLAAKKRELQDLCRAYGLKVSGNKTDVLTRVLRYMDEHGVDVPPDDVEAAEPESPPIEAVAVEPIVMPAVPEAEAAVEDLLRAVEEVRSISIPRVYVEDRDRLRRDRRRFYVGVILSAIGGSGLILGSILHDVLRVPILGEAYTVFGPLNTSVGLIGLVILLAGLAGIGLGLRGGVVDAEPTVLG